MYRSLFTAFLLGVFALSPALASAADTKSAFTEAQKKELSKMFESFILENPETLIASVEGHYNKQAESQAAQEGSLDEVPADLVDANTPAFGPADAKVTVVEFFDYNCGYCKQVANDLGRLMDEEKNVRYVFKELPILSATSEVAARYALAAHKQGKFIDFHMALMNYQGPISEDFLKKTAEGLKLDMKKLAKDADSQELRDALNKNVSAARALGVRGTPFFLFNKEKVPGAIGYSRMKEMVAQQSGAAAAPAAATTSSAAAPAAPKSAATGGDAEFQAELKKAQQETSAMIESLKEEAKKIQKDAEAQLKEAQRLEAEKKAAAEKAAKKD